jgi:hypothetical protein
MKARPKNFLNLRRLSTFWLLFLVLLTGVFLTRSYGQSAASLRLTVLVEKRAKLEISTSFISFTRSSSSGQPQTIPANEGPLDLVVKTNYNSSSELNLWVQAHSDLVDTSSGYVIPVERISWQAEGEGFLPGTMSKLGPVLLARLKGSGSFKGIIHFFFAEDPNFAPGSYRTTATILAEGV